MLVCRVLLYYQDEELLELVAVHIQWLVEILYSELPADTVSITVVAASSTDKVLTSPTSAAVR